MKGDPTIEVCCDVCKTYTDVLSLTALARGCYDERNVDGELERLGWRVDDGEICPECAARPDEVGESP